MNKAILIGNLTRDPETRTVGNGVNKCSFSIAVNRSYANAQGVREADFFNIVAWRQLGDRCARYLQKGRKVCVTGSIQNRTYDAQDGSKRYITEIVADDVEFLPNGNGRNGFGQGDDMGNGPIPPENSPAGGAVSNAAAAPSMEETDDDLPF